MVARVAAGTTTPLSCAFTDPHGDPVEVESATLTITDDWTGTVIVDALDTDPILDGVGPDILPGQFTTTVTLPTLGPHTAVWSGSGGQVLAAPVDVAGGFVFTIGQLRNADPGSALGNPQEYPSAFLTAIRSQAEDRFEQAANVALVPRAARITVAGNGRPIILLHHHLVRTITEVTVDGVVSSAYTIDRILGGLRATRGVWPHGATIDITYTHGFSFPPAAAERGALLVAADMAMESNLPARATSQSSEFGTFRITVAGRDGSLGIPEADSIAASLGFRTPVIG